MVNSLFCVSSSVSGKSAQASRNGRVGRIDSIPMGILAPHLVLAWTLILSSAIAPAEEIAGPEPAARSAESPWLLTPTVSSDPKLGTTLGAVGGYTFNMDAVSRPSTAMAFGTYSDTDSWFAGLFGDVHWGEGIHQFTAGLMQGTIRNDYEDFLGTGLEAKTTDDLEALFLRYNHRLSGNWYLGGQAISSNYAIGADGLLGDLLGQIGLVGFDSNGVGAVLEYDSRDSLRNPTTGQRFVVHNIAYRESLGGDESFDTLTSDYTRYQPFGDGHVFAMQVHGRWTDDAPLGGYSSVTLRGYTRGNYLAENYTHVDLEARLRLRGRFGAAAFAGVGCLYGGVSDCGKGEAIYPAVGAGLIYTLKPEAGFVVRADFAVGDRDNSAFYVRLGQPF